MFDAGNALFRQTGIVDEQSKARAKFILEKYGALGVKALAVGARDLNAGAPWLQRVANEAKVELLSANLAGVDGKAVFKPSTVVTEGGVRVAFIGATAPGPQGDLTAKPAVALVKLEAARLKKQADVIVVLAAVPYADALQLSNELKDSVDFIVQSHEGRGIAIAQKGPGNFLLPAGERGRHVARVDLALDGKDRFQDVGELERNAQMVSILDNQIEEVRRRRDAAKDKSVKHELDKTEADFIARRKEFAATSGGAKRSSRTFKLQFVGLGSDVKDDPAWLKEIDRIDPPATRGH